MNVAVKHDPGRVQRQQEACVCYNTEFCEHAAATVHTLVKKLNVYKRVLLAGPDLLLYTTGLLRSFPTPHHTHLPDMMMGRACAWMASGRSKPLFFSRSSSLPLRPACVHARMGLGTSLPRTCRCGETWGGVGKCGHLN